MKKIIFVTVFFIQYTTGFSQLSAPSPLMLSPNNNVGINEPNPDALLHITNHLPSVFTPLTPILTNLRLSSHCGSPWVTTGETPPSPSHSVDFDFDPDCNTNILSLSLNASLGKSLLMQWSSNTIYTPLDRIQVGNTLNLSPLNSTFYSNWIEVKSSSFNVLDMNSVNRFSINQDGSTNIYGTQFFNVDTRNIIINSDGIRIKGIANDNVFGVYSNGNVRAREVDIDLLPIPDYVFQPSYNLMTLNNLKKYVETNKHLPGIKSEKEFNEIGSMSVGEMNVKLLEKVEELTLYILQLEERISKVEKK